MSLEYGMGWLHPILALDLFQLVTFIRMPRVAARLITIFLENALCLQAAFPFWLRRNGIVYHVSWKMSLTTILSKRNLKTFWFPPISENLSKLTSHTGFWIMHFTVTCFNPCSSRIPWLVCMWTLLETSLRTFIGYPRFQCVSSIFQISLHWF